MCQIIEKKREIKNISKKLRDAGKRIVSTNGCFDILHPGHIEYLEKARKLGDILIVAVNTDKSVKNYKGDKRPINRLKDRMKMLSAVHCIDYVIHFNERTPVEIIKYIVPHIHVKGGDYTAEQLPETETVKSLGGKVIILPFSKGYSSTLIIEKILEVYKVRGVEMSGRSSYRN